MIGWFCAYGIGLSPTDFGLRDCSAIGDRRHLWCLEEPAFPRQQLCPLLKPERVEPSFGMRGVYFDSQSPEPFSWLFWPFKLSYGPWHQNFSQTFSCWPKNFRRCTIYRKASSRRFVSHFGSDWSIFRRTGHSRVLLSLKGWSRFAAGTPTSQWRWDLSCCRPVVPLWAHQHLAHLLYTTLQSSSFTFSMQTFSPSFGKIGCPY